MTDYRQRLQGEVGWVTAAARGQGRAEAVRLTAEGAGIPFAPIRRPADTVSSDWPRRCRHSSSVLRIPPRDRHPAPD